MANYTDDAYFDKILDAYEATTIVHACDGQPTSVADITTRSHGSVAVSPVNWNKAARTGGGREITVDIPAITLTVAGDVDHLAFHDAVNGTFFVRTMTPAQLGKIVDDEINPSSYTMAAYHP